jgi:hypothetical protein|tara:strand:- start:650 stop:886 length:237 start_codon:yes stop_codon:yes gene_type:complete
MKFLKNKFVKWLIFLRFFFPELSKKNQILFCMQFIFFVASITLFFLHIDKMNIAVYHLIATFVFALSMGNMISNSFKI